MFCNWLFEIKLGPAIWAGEIQNSEWTVESRGLNCEMISECQDFQLHKAQES